MRKRMNVIIAGITAVCIFVCVPCVSAFMRYHSLTERCLLSDHIVKGKVLDISTKTVHRNAAFTYYRFYVEGAYRGTHKAGQEILIKAYGGPVGDGRYVIAPDAPLLKKGSRYILFLMNNKQGLNSFAFEQGGVFEIKNDAEGREYVTDYTDRAVTISQNNNIEIADDYISFDGFQERLLDIIELNKAKTLLPEGTVVK